MTRIKIIEDFSLDTTPPIEAGTVIEDALIENKHGDAWFFHPETGEDWLSLAGDFKVLADG